MLQMLSLQSVRLTLPSILFRLQLVFKSIPPHYSVPSMPRFDPESVRVPFISALKRLPSNTFLPFFQRIIPNLLFCMLHIFPFSYILTFRIMLHSSFPFCKSIHNLLLMYFLFLFERMLSLSAIFVSKDGPSLFRYILVGGRLVIAVRQQRLWNSIFCCFPMFLFFRGYIFTSNLHALMSPKILCNIESLQPDHPQKIIHVFIFPQPERLPDFLRQLSLCLCFSY